MDRFTTGVVVGAVMVGLEWGVEHSHVLVTVLLVIVTAILHSAFSSRR